MRKIGERLSRFANYVILVAGLSMAIACIPMSRSYTVSACGNGDSVCGCDTNNVFCASGCSASNYCIFETGICTDEIFPIGHPFCSFSFCDPICGV